MLETVEIPEGKFLMGAPPSEIDSHNSERPQHEVMMSGFNIGKFPVTQAQWRVVAGWPRTERDLNPDPSYIKGDRLPVEEISWFEAVEFCARLAKWTSQAYRLLTEAEWEYACRARTTSPFAFGETISPDYVNYNGEYPYGKAARGQYRRSTTAVAEMGVANPFGLYDIHGNVWEWCLDWYGPYEAEPATDPVGPPEGERRVIRGGLWDHDGGGCRSAYRNDGRP